MGKIFNALEKYNKERRVTTRHQKLKPGDYKALLQYDRATGKLDLKHSLVIQDPGTIDRLVTYRLIEADGSLTPAGKAKYAELSGPEPKIAVTQPASSAAKKTRRTEAASLTEWKEIETAVSETDLEVPLKPGVGEKLTPSDWDFLMQFDRATKKLELKSLGADVVGRLLANDMISKGGKLTPHALESCRELELEELKISEQATSDTGEIAEIAEEQTGREPVNKSEPAVSIVPATAPEAAPEIEPKLASPVLRAPTPKPSLPAFNKEKMDQNLIAFFNPQSFEAEQFKILRSNLLYPVAGNPPRSLMVTSPMPGEGKSFVAANLAISVALNINRHVLLLDCDLRRPSVHIRFGFDDAPGLSDYLANGASLSDLLLRTSIDKLTILPAGRPPDNPSELLSSERMSELLKEATERYQDRFIILDSPPPSLTAETSVLARWIDGVIIVIKHGETPHEAVSEVMEKMGKDKIIGAVMNNFEVYSSRYYGKYYGKGYGKRYGKGKTYKK